MIYYIQEFECPKCGLESHVFFTDTTTIADMVVAIGEEHRRWSPECRQEFPDLKFFPIRETAERFTRGMLCGA
jgi:uncharacterized protein with HEPN domain